MEIIAPWGLRSSFGGEIIPSKEVERRFNENSDFLFPFRFPRSDVEFREFVGVKGELIESDLPFFMYIKGEGIYYEIRAEMVGDYVEFIAKGAERFSAVIRKDGDVYGILKLVENIIGGRLVDEEEGGGVEGFRFSVILRDGVIVKKGRELLSGLPRTREEMRRFCIGERRKIAHSDGVFWSFLVRMGGIRLRIFPVGSIPSWIRGRLERINEKDGIAQRGEIYISYVYVGSEAWRFIKDLEGEVGVKLACEACL